MPLRRIDPNDIRDPFPQGQDKLGERQIILTPNTRLTLFSSGDFIGVPWGIRPNTWQPIGIPAGTGPFILIKTPSGNKYLHWKGNGFFGDTLQIIETDGIWSITGEIDYTFQAGNFVYKKWPQGYGFIKPTGHLANFKIIRIDEHQDNLGRIAFYTCSVESYDTPGVYLVE